MRGRPRIYVELVFWSIVGSSWNHVAPRGCIACVHRIAGSLLYNLEDGSITCMGRVLRAGLVPGAGRASGCRRILLGCNNCTALRMTFVVAHRQSLCFFRFLPLLELVIIYIIQNKCQEKNKEFIFQIIWQILS